MENMKNKLQLIFGDWSLGVKGENFHYIFSYKTGGLESFYARGKEWLYRTPMPVFWRALTDNDRGCHFHETSGIWMSADMFIRVKGFHILVDDKKVDDFFAPGNNGYSQDEYGKKVEIEYEYETITNPAAKVTIAYTVEQGGVMTVKAVYHGVKGLPQLPVFGVRMILPTLAEGFTYEGLSGETYPDRLDGGVPGVYEVEGLPVTPYMLPQECGMHSRTKWVEIRRRTELDNRNKEWKTTTLRVGAAEDEMYFSCLPYTAEELESATHQEELPLPRRTVLCVYGAVRGVGGIDSWGAEVEEAYRVSGEEDHTVSFRLVP